MQYYEHMEAIGYQAILHDGSGYFDHVRREALELIDRIPKSSVHHYLEHYQNFGALGALGGHDCETQYPEKPN